MTVENLPRRQFLLGKFSTLSCLENNQKQNFVGVRPPWSVENSIFVAQCTRCGDCLSVCETNILVKGDAGFPEVCFDNGECTFCGKCVDACKQPIFYPRDQLPWSHKIDIGVACLTLHRIECRTCQDNCPANAIRFKLQMGGVAQPLVNFDACNGCGACVQGCPVNAITMNDLKQNE
ncbi:TPA: ferredoxin-type protein NapF [Haemophilus influenzae]|uniref:ferredoxin-type protein NapF n=1 Tax=Haemophilus influenzae TaxID=727 RepID=UPI000CFF8C3D|nr:ferredoxin-type protein NapF [Haemophilus influenzae]PRI54076.1 NADH dehydrogenase (quinone) [Haemophilus influenzae]PRI58618.1 NADH dehydrogenase (quinone) [Haemophilus influenzae]PRL99788.1 NADH dehydrogenase (quinone) [Haemophilus influenzae]PRM03216.1 NADH dehydrogenase (quinone) [Haemophilus influenzae]